MKIWFVCWVKVHKFKFKTKQILTGDFDQIVVLCWRLPILTSLLKSLSAKIQNRSLFELNQYFGRKSRKISKFVLFLYFRIACSFASSIICNRVPGLTAAQRQLCSEAPDAFVALGDGHMLGADECQYQFKGMHALTCTQNHFHFAITHKHSNFNLKFFGWTTTTTTKQKQEETEKK